jgi:hypothetical protein
VEAAAKLVIFSEVHKLFLVFIVPFMDFYVILELK